MERESPCKRASAHALVFAIEAASQDYLAGFGQIFTSSANPTTALVMMWIGLAGVVMVAGWLFVHALQSANRTMARGLSATRPQPVAEHSPVAPTGTD